LILAVMNQKIFSWKVRAVWFWTGTVKSHMPACRQEQIKKVLEDFCKQTGYKSVVFTATDSKGREIYHTM